MVSNVLESYIYENPKYVRIMIFRTDIKKALIDHRDRPVTDFLGQVTTLLKTEERSYRVIEDRLSILGKTDHRLDSVTCGESFTIEEIRTIAIRYDLRFLDSSVFKGDIPMIALQTIKRRESEMQEAFQAFKILAPGELFQLQDENADPLLFGERSDGHHELIAQWGGDISVLRAVRTYPKRNALTLLATVILFTLLVVFFIPDRLFHIDLTFGQMPMVKPVFFFFLLTFMSSVTAYVWFAFRRQFSSHTWNSRSF